MWKGDNCDWARLLDRDKGDSGDWIDTTTRGVRYGLSDTQCYWRLWRGNLLARLGYTRMMTVRPRRRRLKALGRDDDEHNIL